MFAMIMVVTKLLSRHICSDNRTICSRALIENRFYFAVWGQNKGKTETIKLACVFYLPCSDVCVSPHSLSTDRGNAERSDKLLTSRINLFLLCSRDFPSSTRLSCVKRVGAEQLHLKKQLNKYTHSFWALKIPQNLTGMIANPHKAEGQPDTPLNCVLQSFRDWPLKNPFRCLVFLFLRQMTDVCCGALLTAHCHE